MRRRGTLERVPLIRATPRLTRTNHHIDDGANGIRIWEDMIEEESIIAIENDVDPEKIDDPMRLPFQELSINLLGVNYNVHPEEIVEEEEEHQGDTDHNKDHLPMIGETEVPAPLPEPVRMQTDEIIADGPSNGDQPVDDFHMALMLFTTAADLSRTQYEALIEVLSLATIEGIRNLPKSIRTLRERCRKSFPLLHIKARPIDINLEATPPKTDTPGLVYYFDISEYCRIWLSNPNPKMSLYQGFGQLVDNPCELWHGEAWMESVRSTSGMFARVSGEPLLPSDCVHYVDSSGMEVIGRIKGIALDRRQSIIQTSTSGPSAEGVLSAIINRLVPREQIIPQIEEILATPHKEVHDRVYPLYESELPELVLFELREVIPITSIRCRAWVYFTDYGSPESLQNSLLPYGASFCVKKIIYLTSTSRPENPTLRPDKINWRPIHKRHRVAAENEIIYLTREVVLSNINRADSMRCVSVPLSVFLDGFGLYRNAYHSLKGMYVTPAGLTVDERTKLSSMYVLMIGPFGTNELNMAACLEHDGISMGAGRVLVLESGERVFVTAFPLLFTGDMPQQNQNSGNKTHNAEFGCRSCFVNDKQRGDLYLDTSALGRFRAPVERIYKESISLRTKKAKADALQRYGLTPEGPYFTRCYPMTDPQRSCPNDPFHAELRLCKYYSEALIDGLLSPTGITAYRDAWNSRALNVPYRWGQPQNPVNHKGSMVFSEHGKMAIMNPFVLLIMFSSTPPTKSLFKAGVEERIRTTFGDRRDPKYQVLRTAYLIAKVTHLTLKRHCEEPLTSVILEMRTMLRHFFGSTISTKGGYQKYADVPNIHVGLHYEKDMENFATTFNATTMLGEQKHKIFKMHARHTNSQENDLQLLKLINTLQAVRFALDNTFTSTAPILTKQLHNIVDNCPVLKKRFIGVEEEPTGDEFSSDTYVDIGSSLLRSANTGRNIALKSICDADREYDRKEMTDGYGVEYDTPVTLSNRIKFKIKYWGYLTGEASASGKLLSVNGKRLIETDGNQRFRVIAGAFIRLIGDNEMFRKVERIVSIHIGTMVRVMFVARVFVRDISQENEAAPYEVYRPAAYQRELVGIRRVIPTIFHFVQKNSTEDDESWYHNPFVPHFL